MIEKADIWTIEEKIFLILIKENKTCNSQNMNMKPYDTKNKIILPILI